MVLQSGIQCCEFLRLALTAPWEITTGGSLGTPAPSLPSIGIGVSGSGIGIKNKSGALFREFVILDIH